MKRMMRWMAAAALALTIAVPGVGAAANDMGMKAKVDYNKVDMMMKDGMELVALRQVAESLGYVVTWNDMERSVTLTRSMMGMTDTGMPDKNMTDKNMMDKSMMDMYTVKIVIGSKTATVAMKENMLAYEPVILDNKTYVSKAFVDMYLADFDMMMK